MRTTVIASLAATCAAALLVACGGGSSSAPAASTTTTPPPAAASTTISGNAVKGPVNAATVTVKNAATGAVLGTTTTGAGGAYTLNVAFTGDVIVEVSGGTYTDEATGATTTLSTPLKVVLAANGGNVTGMVTPLTTMAYSNAFPSATTPVSSAGFNSTATTLANQFHLTGVNLATTAPVVTGTLNAYGKALAGISKYLQLNNASLQSVISTAFTTNQWSQFSVAYSGAYNTINPGTPITFAFNGSAFTIGGTGAGGGSGTCGVKVAGSVTVGTSVIPLDMSYCVSGIAAGSCTSSNSTLSQALNGQGGFGGAVNLAYTYSPTCAAGAITIALQ